MRNIFLIGPMASGKTSIGRILAKQLDLNFYDSDDEIESRSGVNIAWIFDVEGEQGFRRREESIIAELTRYPNIILSTGGGVVLSPSNRQLLSARGYVIYLQVSLEQQLLRTEKDRDRPLLQCAGRKNTLQLLRSERHPLYQEVAHWHCLTDGYSPRQVATFIANHIAEVMY